MNIVYITYDVNLKHYLRDCGIDNLFGAKHMKTDKPFWVYERTEELQKHLDDWFKKT